MCLLGKRSLKAQAPLLCPHLSLLTLNLIQIGLLGTAPREGLSKSDLVASFLSSVLLLGEKQQAAGHLRPNKMGTLMRESGGWWEAERPLTQARGPVG